MVLDPVANHFFHASPLRGELHAHHTFCIEAYRESQRRCRNLR
jgi:hypothetical protein